MIMQDLCKEDGQHSWRRCLPWGGGGRRGGRGGFKCAFIEMGSLMGEKKKGFRSLERNRVVLKRRGVPKRKRGGVGKEGQGGELASALPQEGGEEADSRGRVY